jgi:hypothetical protein
MLSTITKATNHQALRRAAAAARLAPSIHNSQPWGFRLAGGGLDMVLDLSRRLCVVDPDGRQALISCGCALFNARVELAHNRFGVHVERFPNGRHDPVFARLHIVADDDRGSDPELAELERAVRLRNTNRRRFDGRQPAEELIARWNAAAAKEDSILVAVRRAEQRETLAGISRRADALENADPSYRAELRAWTHDDPMRSDGVPDFAIPHVDSSHRDQLPLRDFDTRGTGRLPADVGSSADQMLLVLGTEVEDQLAWLRAGEALERVLLEMTRYGWSASPLTQSLELPQTRFAVAHELGLTFHPQFLMRVGHTHAQTPTTPRRPLSEMLDGDD